MGQRLLIFAICLGISSAGLMAWLKDGNFEVVAQVWRKITNGGKAAYPVERFQVELADRLNYARMATRMEVLRGDMDLHNYLQKYATEPSFEDLNRITRDVQVSLPRYARVVACSASSPTIEGLLDQFHEFAQQSTADLTHLACVLKQTAGGLGNTALVVLGRRLPDFTPELLTEGKTNEFFSVCRICKHEHICRVSNKQRSMTLECPSCRKNYAVVAADSKGRFRYVNEFLTGYAPPARLPKDLSRLQMLFTIWGAVHENCHYTHDPGGKHKQTDNWQTAVETQNLRTGDCEDSAIFLADWLISRGFTARVALGRYGDMGGHAWCVVRLEEKDYLLESTESEPDPENPPLAALIGSRYVPEVLFDRNAIYVRNMRTFNGEYWSERSWTKIEPRANVLAPGKAPVLSANLGLEVLAPTENSKLYGTSSHSPDRVSVARDTEPAVAPFAAIERIPRGMNDWRVPVDDGWQR